VSANPFEQNLPIPGPIRSDRCGILWLKEGAQRHSTCPNYAVTREPPGETQSGASVLTLTKPKGCPSRGGREGQLPGFKLYEDTTLSINLQAEPSNPVSRQVDPAFARKVVAYPSPAPRARLSSIRVVTFCTWYRAADKRSVTGSALAGKDLGGRVRLPFTPNRNGRTGTHPPKCYSGNLTSENT
jgi:hypothetical protein